MDADRHKFQIIKYYNLETCLIFLLQIFYYQKFLQNSLYSENFDEGGLLIDIKISELALKITKCTFGWSNFPEPIKEAHILLDLSRKLSLEISGYENKMDSNLSEYQRNIIYNSMDDLEKLMSNMKNKIDKKSNDDNSYESRIEQDKIK